MNSFRFETLVSTLIIKMVVEPFVIQMENNLDADYLCGFPAIQKLLLEQNLRSLPPDVTNR